MVIKMLTIKLVSKDAEVVIYNYFPENDFEAYPGNVKIRISDKKVISGEKSSLEGDDCTYLGHAVFRIKNNIEKHSFPESELVDWG